MRRDSAYLLDMLLAAKEVRQLSHGLEREQFEADPVMQHAMMRLIQIIGEASRKVSLGFRQAHPEIPWAAIIGMRHRLVHEYFRIKLEVVWEVIDQDIPALIPLIEPLIPPDTQGEDLPECGGD